MHWLTLTHYRTGQEVAVNMALARNIYTERGTTILHTVICFNGRDTTCVKETMQQILGAIPTVMRVHKP